MKKNSSIMLFFIMMILGTTITASSNNWLIMWTGLEINMMAFLPLIALNKLDAPEASMIYFLIQSLGSMILLFSVLMNWNQNILTMMAIMVKMGAAPFHFWMILIMEKMSWLNCLILMTWQKIAPMVMIIHMKPMMMLASISIIVGAIGGLNQSSLRKLIAFSSVNHIGWMLSISELKTFLFMKYLIMYTIMMTMMVLFLFNKKIFQLNQITENLNMVEKINFSIMMLSIGGLPPFLGFITKWMVIQEMMNKSMLFLMILMIMLSMITLFFYIRMISSLMLMEYNFIKSWMFHKPKKSQMMMMMTNLFILPMVAMTMI
uniref:NADH-ubiquinone oxidoreductase chain 2 n=1 Tax=Micronecta sahlbergii TaxID=2304347 RepID=A0A346LZJ8_9HEMI|nr:NADH dehydrogenase subunit 2 [Micronecta sahlbergii]AXQ02193.1 NADH dehydrogenase subunit 2 [Micronecta sahlbergii]